MGESSLLAVSAQREQFWDYADKFLPAELDVDIEVSVEGTRPHQVVVMMSWMTCLNFCRVHSERGSGPRITSRVGSVRGWPTGWASTPILSNGVASFSGAESLRVTDCSRDTDEQTPSSKSVHNVHTKKNRKRSDWVNHLFAWTTSHSALCPPLVMAAHCMRDRIFCDLRRRRRGSESTK